MLFRIPNLQFDPQKTLDPERFQRLTALVTKPSLTEKEHRELTDLKRRAIKKHLQLVEAAIDAELDGQESDPEIEELLGSLEIG
jgi:hypothetical protein